MTDCCHDFCPHPIFAVIVRIAVMVVKIAMVVVMEVMVAMVVEVIGKLSSSSICNPLDF